VVWLFLQGQILITVPGSLLLASVTLAMLFLPSVRRHCAPGPGAMP
jgi:hypothetical protein